MGIDKLIGSLLTYKMKRKSQEEETRAKRDIALKVVDEKEDDESSMDEKDVSLAKRFNKFFLRSKKNKGRNI